jgi:hypothetical protein
MDPASSKQASVHQSYSVQKQGTQAICNKVGYVFSPSDGCEKRITCYVISGVLAQVGDPIPVFQDPFITGITS